LRKGKLLDKLPGKAKEQKAVLFLRQLAQQVTCSLALPLYWPHANWPLITVTKINIKQETSNGRASGQNAIK
jgi:hypothetical protein